MLQYFTHEPIARRVKTTARTVKPITTEVAKIVPRIDGWYPDTTAIVAFVAFCSSPILPIGTSHELLPVSTCTLVWSRMEPASRMPVMGCRVNRHSKRVSNNRPFLRAREELC